MQLTADERSTFLSRLRAVLPVARWFRGKARRLRGLEVAADAPLDLGDGTTAHFLLVRADYREGESELYFVPVLTPGLGEALQSEAFRKALLRLIVRGESITTSGGRLAGQPGQAARGAQLDLPSEALALEQSNSAVAYGEQFFLKVFRVPELGANPDIELGRFLTEEADFANAPVFAGTLTLDLGEGEPRVLALMQRRIEALGDAWPLACALAAGDLQAGLVGASRQSLQLANELGLRTAELHAALAQGTAPTLAPEPFGEAEYTALEQRVAQRCGATAELLRAKQSGSALADALAARATGGASAVRGRRRLGGSLVRIHGDYHLGQVLVRADGALIITDFEGEPARSLAERRQKRSPLVDVAGMLRSFDYAAATAARDSDRPVSAGWREAMSRRFLKAYYGRIPADLLPPKATRDAVLDLLLLEKAAYELAYELNNRPDWVAIPQGGLERLLGKDEG
ncbi:MAG: phosphotransferase [Verrucomicrobia bacterium]|nr:phosphotransferase [Verrucomicrobiota bacterium]